MGMSGELFMTGDSDRRPVNVSVPQACLHAGADAAVGSMLAHHHRRMTGEGQHVDVSMQQSAAWFLAQTMPHWEIDKLDPRQGGHLSDKQSGHFAAAGMAVQGRIRVFLHDRRAAGRQDLPPVGEMDAGRGHGQRIPSDL